MSETIYQFWRHAKSGEVYAVRVEGSRVTGCCGPLHHGDRHPDQLPDYVYRDNLEDAAWADARQEEFALYEP